MQSFQSYLWVHALNFSLEGAQQFSFVKGHFFEEIVSFYLNLAEGTTATAVGCKAGGVVGYSEACGRLTFGSNLDL